MRPVLGIRIRHESSGVVLRFDDLDAARHDSEVTRPHRGLSYPEQASALENRDLGMRPVRTESTTLVSKCLKGSHAIHWLGSNLGLVLDEALPCAVL